MELRVNEVVIPEKITFNYEELRQELTAKVSMYETLVYTDDQIKQAKADKANLNKLKKALNDERIRREKEYMKPFDKFKAQINEIIGIIDKPVAVIDSQVKAYEKQQKADKLAKIQEYYKNIEQPEMEWLGLPAIYDEKWLNASVSMKSIQDEINTKLEQIKTDLATLTNLPEFSFEATEVYKSTLDINKAISEGARLSEMAKAKAAHEAELAKRRIEEEQNAKEKAVVAERAMTAEETAVSKSIPPKTWVKFQAFMTTEDAYALKEFFNSRNIEYKAV